jgi:transcription antitermination factor NusA-like protein
MNSTYGNYSTDLTTASAQGQYPYAYQSPQASDPSILEAVRAVAKTIAAEVAEKVARDPEFYDRIAPQTNKISCTMKCPQAGVGKVIGRRGEAIANVQAQTGCAVQVDQSTKDLGYSLLLLSAPNEESLQRGMLMVEAMIASTQPILLPEGIHHLPSGQEQHVLDIPENTVGGVIGVKGSTIQQVMNEFGVTMYVDQSSPVGMNKKAAVIGPRDNCLRAIGRIHDIISGRWQPGQENPVQSASSTQDAAYAQAAAYYAAQTGVATAGEGAGVQQMTPDLIAQWLEYYRQYYAAMGQQVPAEILASLGQPTE